LNLVSRARGLALALAGAAVLVACAPGAAPTTGTGPSIGAGPTTTTNVGPKPSGCPSRPPAALPKGESRTVAIETRKGAFTITVRADLAPLAAGNFVTLAECGFYTGVVFHRLVPGFVIQGGDRTGTGRGDPGYKIQDEPVTRAYTRGTVAMARTPAPNSQGAQFFIVLADSNSLAATNTYAIFGSVTGGMETVDAIAAMPNSGSPNNTALDPVAMDRVTVSKP
jgi:cyclophilin family peptidyl-prolyl cis-trans isomerase